MVQEKMAARFEKRQARVTNVATLDNFADFIKRSR
jgi:hypothetical protein